MTTTPPAEMIEAYRAGWQAFARDEPRAPAANKVVMGMLASAKVGEQRTLDLFGAFTRGYDAALEHEAEVWATF